MPFGQIVIGPPGSGKTTFCAATARFLARAGRDTCVVNLDPANDAFSYPCGVDIADLVRADQTQDQLQLGPNGALLYCMDYLQKNMDWLHERLAPHIKAQAYFVFDCPGQAELHMCHDSFQGIANIMVKDWHMRLTVVQLVDSHLCTGPHKYLSALLMCLASMLHLELPHVNILSKMDLLENMNEGDPLDVDKLTDVDFLRHQLAIAEDSFASRYHGLSTGLCDVVDNYGLMNFMSLAVENEDSLRNVIDAIEGANGYKYSGLQGCNPYAKTG